MKDNYQCIDSLRMTSTQQELAVRYVPFARALAKPLRIAYSRVWDELESAALFALVQAAVTFDPSRNIPFPTYARHRIRGALRDTQRDSGARGWAKRWKFKKPTSQVPLSPTSEERGLVLNTREDPPIGAALERSEEVERCLRRLPSRHASACRQLYLDGKPRNEVAEELGCSRSRLSVIHREARIMLNR
jgi:RNA polymerase sigma factor (sigma-70 family)